MVIMPMAGMPFVPSIHGAATTVSIPAAICSSPASPGTRLPGIVNVATVTYRTHVYYTPAYPSVILRLPALRPPLRPDAGPDLQQALLLLSRSASFGDVSHGSRTE